MSEHDARKIVTRSVTEKRLSVFKTASFFGQRSRLCRSALLDGRVPFQPFPYMGHVVFGGNDRSALVDRRETGAFVAVDPLLERCGAPRFGVVEEPVQRADRLRECNDKCFVIHKAAIS